MTDSSTGIRGDSAPTFWHAPEIANAGLRVFPIKDKAPSVAGGFYAATTDHSQIAAWIEDGRGDHDIAMPTGIVSDIVVIDADSLEAYSEMEDSYGPPTVRTRRGGHWWFRHPRDGKVISANIKEGLDRKADGGYVVVPPSRGRTWTSGIPEKDKLPVLPRELRGEKKRSHSISQEECTLDPGIRKRAAAAITRHVRTIPKGKHHEHLRHLCGALLRKIPAPDAHDILVQAWTDVGGEYAERAEHEIANTLATTQTAIEEGRATGGPEMDKITPGLYNELADTFRWYATLKQTEEPKAQDEVRSQSQSLGNEVVSSDPERSIRAVSFRGREKPGPREWIVDKAICKGHPASWYGESGIAKSLLAVHMALHVAADGVERWAGLRVKTVPVIYGDFELDEHEHLRRAQELAAGMGLPDVPTKFYYLPLTGLPAAEAFEIAAEECRRVKAGLFIVDSVGFALDGDSELAKDVLRFYRECIQPIRDAGATPFLIDHQAKVIKGEKYSDKQEFGSVYKTNAVRSSFQVRGAWDGNELTTTFTHKKTNFGPKVEPFSLCLRFGKDLISVERLEDAARDPDREPSKKEQVLAAVEEMKRATSETVAAKTGINPLTVRNAISALLKEGELVDTGEKEGSYRIVATHSHTTQGSGPGANGKPLSGLLDPGETATGEQLRRIRKLMDEGTKKEWAKRAILGEDA